MWTVLDAAAVAGLLLTIVLMLWLAWLALNFLFVGALLVYVAAIEIYRGVVRGLHRVGLLK